MNTPSEDLFELIAGMESSEKRHFKLFVNRLGPEKEQKKYLVLFDVLNKQKTYDEDAVKKKVKHLIGEKRFSKAKNYLAEAITDSLLDFYARVSVASRIENHLQKARIALDKKMKKAGMRYLARAEKLAQEYDEFEYLLVINALGRKHFLHDAAFYAQNKTAAMQNADHERNISRIQQQWKLQNLVIAIRAGLVNNSGVEKQFTPLFEAFDLLGDDPPASFSALRSTYFIRINRLSIADRNKEAVALIEEYIVLMESEPEKLTERSWHYLGMLINLLSAYHNSGMFAEQKTVSKKFVRFYHALPPKRKTLLLKELLIRHAIVYATNLSSLKKYEEAIITLESVAENFENVETHMQLLVLRELTNNCFITQNSKAALKYANAIIRFDTHYRQDVQLFARVVFILLQYELENFDSISSFARSMGRFIKKYEQENNFADRFFAFFSKPLYGKLKDKEFLLLQHTIGQHFEVLHNLTTLQYTQYIIYAWANSKLSGKPLTEVID